MKIRDLLLMKDAKYRDIVTIEPDETILAAIQKLVEHDRGSLAVCDEGKLVGIITERDIVRKCLAYGNSYANVRVREAMTSQVAIGTPDDDLDYAISVMKQKRIRHMPILDGQKVIGMISMRDLLGVQLEETKAQVRYSGLLPGRAHTGRSRLI
jgi:CBS domain-containing protein